MVNFTHLHVHSDASQMDGLGAIASQTVEGKYIPGLVETAKNKGFKALGLTDHGTLANTVSFVVTCKQFGIKPIVGLEGYLQEADEIFHITLLADGKRGFSNLVKLNNEAMKSDTRRPSFTLDQLKKYNRDIICLSGCPASPLQILEWSEARQIGIFLKDTFQDRFFAEMMFVQRDFSSWERSLQIAIDLKIPLVVTNDVHFSSKEKAYSNTMLKKIKAPFLDYDSSLLWLATADELTQRLTDWGLNSYVEQFKGGIENAYQIGQKVKPIELNPAPSLPEIEDADRRFIELIDLAYLAKPELVENNEYEKRIDFELATIQDMDFSSYFIILKDIIDYAKSQGILIGPGRGSGVGSLILYLLGITDIDPIEYGLSFERFLNPQRKEMPDVDIDVPGNARQKIIDYAAKRWSAVPIATYGRYSEKALIQEIVKVLGYDVATKLAASAGGFNGEVTKSIREEQPGFDIIYRDMFGQIRNTSKHAGGIVITKPDDDVPLVRAQDGQLIAGWTEGQNKELSQAGLVKFDFLGIKALDILSILEKKHGKASKPIDHSPIFNLFKKGNVTGIFQFDTNIMRDLSLQIQPDTFNDLIAQVALKLPGPLNAGTTAHYIEYKQKPRLVHPLFDDILAKTYGIICYQEQFMSIYAKATDGDLSDADFARKVIVKANPGNATWEKQYTELKEKFVTGCANHGIDLVLANEIWNEINTHSRYSFNKAHATAYTMISWYMAYFKYYHTADFYAALLTVHGDNPDKVEEYVFSAVENGVEIVSPHVNISSMGYETNGNKIYMSLTSINYLADIAAKLIIENQPYNSFEEFVSRLPKSKVNKRVKKGLKAVGAFDGLTGDSSVLEIDDITETTDVAIQKAYLGYVIPTKALVKTIRDMNDRGKKAGIIKSVELKESKNGFGDFWRFNLLPTGSVWSRNPKMAEYLSIGLLFAFDVTEYGKITGVMKL